MVHTFRFLFLVVAFWIGAVSPCFSEGDGDPFSNDGADAPLERVNLVLVIDASGSMLLTDPLKVRFEGAKLVSQFLKPGDRLAIVGFDREARVLRPLMPFKSSDSAAIAAAIEQVGNAGEYTDILSGVRAAKEILDGAKDTKAASVVILLSDGKMEPAPEVGTAAQQTDVLLNEYLPDLKAEGIRVHTLAFSESADRQLLGEIALATEGTKMFVPEADDLQQAYTDLFMSVKKPQVLPLTSKGFKIDSGIQEATFYINREGSDQPLKLKTPEGETVSQEEHPGSIRWFVGKKFDVITITEPAPGDWQIIGMASTDSFATVLTNLKLITEWPTTFTVGAPVTLRARLYENEKPIVLPEMAGATKYAFEIIPTDRISEPVVREFLHDDGEKGDKVARDGIFTYRLPLEEPGEYRLRVIARAPTFQRSQQVAFRVKPRMITVAVEQEEAGDAHGGEAAAAHDGAGHGAHDPHDAQESEGHGPAHEEHPEGASGDNEPAKVVHAKESFRIVLSAEAQALKKIEVKLVALASDGKRYVVPVEGHGGVYHAYPRSLPFEGEYTLTATLTGESRKKERVSEESPKLTYRKRKGGEAEVQAEVLVVEHNVPEPSSIPYLIVVVLINAGLGGLLFTMLKRQVGGTTIEAPKFAPPSDALAAIAFLEEKMKLVEIDVNEAIFQSTEPVLLPSDGQEGGGTATAAAPSAPEPAPSEVPPVEPEEGAAPPPPPPPAAEPEAEKAEP